MSVSFPMIQEDFEKKGYRFKIQEPLKNHTTFKIGGCCSILALPQSTDEILDMMAVCRNADAPVFLLGKGSNLLVSDEGFDGVVLKLTNNFAKITVKDTVIEAESGASLSSVCHTAYENGLTGLEFAWGIPGTIGGALFMNAGAYGGEMKDVVCSSEHIDKDNKIGSFEKEQLDLTYRHSIYADLPGYCITKVVLKLERGNRDQIKARMDDLMERRKSKQPLEYPSAGSTFKRPEGNYASALIEQCGLKGLRCGGAQVSEKHAGFLINAGDATCADVCELIERVKKEVRQQTGYQLECEVKRL